MTTIFANVRTTSKYCDQAQAKPFPVELVPDGSAYHWKGGEGGQYRTADLVFFRTVGDKLFAFDLCDLTSFAQLSAAKEQLLGAVGQDWNSTYWCLVIEIAGSMLSTANSEYEAAMEREHKERLSEECW